MKMNIVAPVIPLTQIDTETIDGQVYPVLASYYETADDPHDCDLSKVWCDFCWCWHTHGRGNGHRLAHCWGRSPRQFRPYAKHGYILREVGPWTPGLAKYGKGKEHRLNRPFWCKSCSADLPAMYQDTSCPLCGGPTTARQPARLLHGSISETVPPRYDVSRQVPNIL